MHELTVANRLLERAIEAAEDHGADRIEALTVAVGTATHLSPDQLSFCLDAIREDTPAADATLSFERVAARGQCDCGWSGHPPAADGVAGHVPSVRCPACGGRIELTAGRECRLTAVEVADRDIEAGESGSRDGATAASDEVIET